MKKTADLILTICFLLLFSNISFAQQEKRSSNKERAKTERQAEKREVKEKKEKSHDHRGHAHGKHKCSSDKKDYGQEMARQAKLRKEHSENELESTISRGDLKIKESKEKIQRSREKLEKEKKEGTITDEAYKIHKEKIDKAEKGLNYFEEKIREGRKMRPTSCNH